MSVYAEVKGTTLIKFPYTVGDLQADNPYTNYGPNPDLVVIFPQTTTAITNGYTLAPVTYLPMPTYDPATQIAVQNANPTLNAGTWELGWTVRLMTPDEINAKKAAVKSQAQQLLSETDWASFPSVADPGNNPYLKNADAFQDYRQQLRVIAVNPTTNPTFPTKPVEVWGP